MSDFEEKLNAILSNADAMDQVMKLAQSLDLGGSSGDGGGRPPPRSDGGDGGSKDGGSGGGGLGDLLGALDPKLVGRLLPLLGELTGGGDDQRRQLLYALRPFLKPERRDKIDRALKTAKLLHVGKKLLTTMGDGDV